MRIISWNVYRGECRTRAAELDTLEPDLAVLQECAKPSAPEDDCCRWFGDNPIQGVGVLAKDPWTLNPVPLSPDVPDSAYPVQMVGPGALNVLAVWTKKRPTYVQALLGALDQYRSFLTSGPSIVLGDFNSHWQWDGNSSRANHSKLVEVLREEFGLVSAYHAHGAGCLPGDEQASLYWRWKQESPFHVDYCFVPEAWVSGIRAVEVGGDAEWEGKSDHRPLIVDLDDELLATS